MDIYRIIVKIFKKFKNVKYIKIVIIIKNNVQFKQIRMKKILIIKLKIWIIFVLNVRNKVIGVKIVLLKYKLASDVRNKDIMQMIVKKIGKKMTLFYLILMLQIV